ncbi:hypothetical protein ACFZAR_05335 [Streptomyces sp. NPDC008222]|uniref:hypothetical protein n=1 Tax=Streptomyces sp. NPDC008222 TaxID=3364820 RepID=UPI0036E47CA8
MTPDLQALVARQRETAAVDAENVQTLAAARARTHSPSDQLAYALDAWLVEHHEAPLSTNADYPAWAAALAATNHTPEETAR